MHHHHTQTGLSTGKLRQRSSQKTNGRTDPHVDENPHLFWESEEGRKPVRQNLLKTTAHATYRRCRLHQRLRTARNLQRRTFFNSNSPATRTLSDVNNDFLPNSPSCSIFPLIPLFRIIDIKSVFSLLGIRLIDEKPYPVKSLVNHIPEISKLLIRWKPDLPPLLVFSMLMHHYISDARLS